MPPAYPQKLTCVVYYPSEHSLSCLSFFFNDTATTEIYTLSLHDALPISQRRQVRRRDEGTCHHSGGAGEGEGRSEEHTSELQSHLNLVCRLLLEKKKNNSSHRPLTYQQAVSTPSSSIRLRDHASCSASTS